MLKREKLLSSKKKNEDILKAKNWKKGIVKNLNI